jgi:hypothetical protein
MISARSAAPGIVWPAAAGVVALVAAVVPSATADGAPARAAVETLLMLSIAGVLGIVAVAALGLVQGEEQRNRLLDLSAALAAAWTVLAAGTGFVLYLGEAPAPDSPAFGPGLVSFVADVEIGRTWAIAAGCAAVLTAFLLALRSRPGVLVLWGLSLLALVPVALQSALAGQALEVQRVLDAAGFVQVVALGTWAGAIALGAARTALPLVAAGAAAVSAAAALPALLADGAVGPLSVVGAAPVVVAGALAVVTTVSGRRTGGAQLLLVALGIGLGVAASILRSAAEAPARTTPAQILTGSSLPPAPSLMTVLAAWRPDPLWLVVVVGLLGVGAALRRRSTWSAARTVSWVLGALLVAWLTSGAPAVYAGTLLPALLVQSAGLLLPVPLLLAGGRPRKLLGAGVPARPVLAAATAVAVPLVLLGTDALRWTVTDPLGREAGPALVLGAGGLLVAALAGTTVRRSTAVGVLVALLVVETGVAAAVAFGPALLLADWYGAMGWGTDALATQRSAALPLWLLLVVPTVLLLLRATRAQPGAVRETKTVTA